MHNEFTYVVQTLTDDDPWPIAFCPGMPKAYGQGKTEQDDAIDNLRPSFNGCSMTAGNRGYAVWTRTSPEAW